MCGRAEGRGDAELEIWAANRSARATRTGAGPPVRLQARIVDDPEATAAARAGVAPAPVEAPVRRKAKRAPTRRKPRVRKTSAKPSRNQPEPAPSAPSVVSQPEPQPEPEVDEGDASDELAK